LILASLVVAPAAAHAQFATFIPPKGQVPDSVAAVKAAAQKARRDSASAARIVNMKQWVDSAAGLPPRPTRAADSVLAPRDTFPVLVATARGRTAPAIPAPAPRPSTPSTRPGARAPATASELPLMLLVGALLLVTGMILLAGEPRRRRNA
jgi:hypothetical protein